MDKLILHQRTKEDVLRIIGSGFHAVGIEGKNGSGKKFLADHLAKKVMRSDDVPGHPHIFVVDCESKTGIEETREAVRFLSLKIPGDDRYKRCLMFYSFEKLGYEAQNSLLKSFEEPPQDTLIIITVESKGDIPPTIVSRLAWLNILPVSETDALDYFQPKHDREKINNAYILAEGRMGMMSELLENYDRHPLVLSITGAKEIIRMDRFERLAKLESIVKSEQSDRDAYLWALAKILRAAARSQTAKTGAPSKKLMHNLKLVASALNAQRYNSNQKAVLTELFYGL